MTEIAAAPTMTTANEPDGAPRLAGLDILRGIAILGILFMNINDMGGSLWVMLINEESRYGWTVADKAAWFARELFANGTARCMLEMLFGVGMMLLTDRAASAVEHAADGGRFKRAMRWMFGPWAVMKGYYWRNFVLFLFGLVHVLVLLWPGDILHTYGLAALVAFLFRRMGPKTMLSFGLLLALVQAILGGFMVHQLNQAIDAAPRLEAKQKAGQTLTKAEADQLKMVKTRETSRAKDKAEGLVRVEKEDKARKAATGNFQSWAATQWDVFLTFEGWGLEVLFVWEAFSTMLIGAALFKWGVIQGKRSRTFYTILLLIGYGFGFAVRGYLGYRTVTGIEGPSIAGPLYELARLATTLGHISAVWLLLGTAFGRGLLKPFEAAGRTALTVYIAQTMICLWVLYPPWGYGLYGQHSWATWMFTAFAINAWLLIGANLWVRRYRIAPVEWLWRSIISEEPIAFRKKARAVAAA